MLKDQGDSEEQDIKQPKKLSVTFRCVSNPPSGPWCLLMTDARRGSGGHWRGILCLVRLFFLYHSLEGRSSSDPHVSSTPRTYACLCLCKSKIWLPKMMIFVPVWLFPFRDQNSMVPFGLGSKLSEDCKPMSSYYKVNFPNYIDKK